MIKITNVDGGIIYVSDTVATIREAAIDAVRKGISLSWANLHRANLSGANMSEANMSEADLSEADLSEADLSGANLHRANMLGANMLGANISEANLSWADLSGADLSGADLHRANLHRANMSRANMSRANMSKAIGLGNWVIFGPIRSDGAQYMLSRTMPGPFRVWAGDRDSTLAEARARAANKYVDSTDTSRILDYLELEAEARGWQEWTEE